MEGGDPRAHDEFWARQFGLLRQGWVETTLESGRVHPPYTPLSRASRDHGPCWACDNKYIPELTTREVLMCAKECSICFESVAAREEVYSLKCTHRFHDACLKPWAEHNTTCPSCRGNLS